MNIRQTFGEAKRRTTAEEVFDRLRDDIVALRLAPGSKLSEVEVAKLCEVSRQPVREAFMRLGDLNLLQIRPQKATLVRKISLQEIRNTRFVRAAVEVEVVRFACETADEERIGWLRSNLVEQQEAVRRGEPLALQKLDYDFHRLICLVADREHAFQTIAENKTHTERICTLELNDAKGMAEVLEGHTDIVDAIARRDVEGAVELTRHHLAHLDDTIAKACKNHPEFFEA